jgi:hypothetical protein
MLEREIAERVHDAKDRDAIGWTMETERVRSERKYRFDSAEAALKRPQNFRNNSPPNSPLIKVMAP